MVMEIPKRASGLGVRTSNVSVLLSVLCLVIALSDCIIIVSSYSDGELLLTRIHMSLSFPYSSFTREFPTGVSAFLQGTLGII